MTSGFDVLRDEGIAYADRLDRAGVKTEHLHYPSMIHGFVSMSRLFSEAGDAIEKSAKAMKASFRQIIARNDTYQEK